MPKGEPVSASHLRKRERGIWQRRYWEHTLRDENDFARHRDYLHFNPVKHGHVGRVKDWPFSSFHRMVRLGIYSEDWADDVADQDGSFGEPDCSAVNEILQDGLSASETHDTAAIPGDGLRDAQPILRATCYELWVWS